MKQRVTSVAAPAAIGPYSQAIRAGRFLFLSGQIALDPVTGGLVGETAAEQVRQVLANMEAVLAAAGATFEDLVKTTIFLVDFADFAAVNEVYGAAFPDVPPARSTVQVSRLPRDARVEIEGVAVLGDE
jgi:2-iminobutanoate/2-iminopropanoate deaminase